MRQKINEQELDFKIYGFDSSVKYCMYCEQAKLFLKRNKKTFKFFPIHEEHNKQDLLKLLNKTELTGTTMPQIFFGEKYIGGFSDLKEKVNSGEIVL